MKNAAPDHRWSGIVAHYIYVFSCYSPLKIDSAITTQIINVESSLFLPFCCPFLTLEEPV